MMEKKTWADKLAKAKGLPKKVKARGKKMVVPAPKDIDRLMKKPKKGKLITVNMIMGRLSKKYKTQTCCPLTTGIFVWIAANAAQEELDSGKKIVTPFWRTLKSDGSLNPKYPGGEMAQAKRLLKEGHRLARKGTKLVVQDFERKLQRL
jgi:hypothetical protein